LRHELPLLRMRALLARAHSDEVAYRDYVARCRDMATGVGYGGHIAMAYSMAAELALQHRHRSIVPADARHRTAAVGC
jgi:hypothetical protein